jgi:RNA polymerase sigma factor (sigma-70 family)
MPHRTSGPHRLLRTLLRPSEPDADLLAWFIADRDAEAFAHLVGRHGLMVLAVCRQVLGCAHDAEDAFQATFLVLARRAGAVGRRPLLANWLYGVAYRTALEARRAAAARRAKEQRATAMRDTTVVPDSSEPDLHEVFDRELAALPEVYRAAVVVCDLEGLSRSEAAERLGWTEGTLSGRLARARALLARRLAGYGLAVPAGVLGVAVYLEGDGDLEHAQQIAAHESPRATKLYDRTSDEVSVEEIEKIRL